jgi:hypothetical protein
LTGRKNAVDTYGEYARQSGAALSGKDPTRIDRVGAYAARYAAKNVVAAGLATECEVQLSYSIGLVRPVSVQGRPLAPASFQMSGSQRCSRTNALSFLAYASGCRFVRPVDGCEPLSCSAAEVVSVDGLT